MRFTLITTTLSVLVYQIFDIYELQFAGLGEAMKGQGGPEPGEVNMQLILTEVIVRYASVFYFLTIPIVVLSNRLLYFRQPFNLAEHTVLACIQAAGSILIVLAFDFVNFVLLDGRLWLVGVGYLAYWVYMAYCLRRGIGKSWMGALTKSSISLLVMLIAAILLGALLVPLGLRVYEWLYGAEAVRALVAPYVG